MTGGADTRAAATPEAPSTRPGGAVAVCTTCPHGCRLAPGARGRCRARRNDAGTVVAENYGRVTSLALDPVEKKPLARFMPGSLVLSAGSYGCNLTCPFCQNHEIAQAGAGEVPWRSITPDELVRTAADLRARDPRVAGIAFTYNEPLVGWEYVRDCAARAHEAGLVNVLVSNGLATPPIIDGLAPVIDAANIDLKGFSAAFYERCGGGSRAFDQVRRTIETLARTPSCHLEVTTLIIPGLNDTDEEMDAEARWLAALETADHTAGDTQVTLHVTRFSPRWRMADRPPTPVARVYRLAEVARRHLAHVYTGNC